MSEFNRKANRIGKAGRASERLLAKSLGVKAQPASGAMQGAKGDIDLDTVLMEAKSTSTKTLSLQLEWLAKIAHEARTQGKSPALAVAFTRTDGVAVRDGEWVMVPKYVWDECLR